MLLFSWIVFPTTLHRQGPWEIALPEEQSTLVLFLILCMTWPFMDPQCKETTQQAVMGEGRNPPLMYQVHHYTKQLGSLFLLCCLTMPIAHFLFILVMQRILILTYEVSMYYWFSSPLCSE